MARWWRLHPQSSQKMVCGVVVVVALLISPLHFMLSMTTVTLQKLKTTSPTMKNTKKQQLHNNSHNISSLLDAICPNVQPDPAIMDRLGPVLFELARAELPLEWNATWKNRTNTAPSESLPRYWSGLFDGWTRVTSSTKDNDSNHNVSLVYVREWKCGNNNIREWINRFLIRQQNWTLSDNYQPHNLSSSASATNICFVTAIRDPISKFLSGYNEFDYRARTQGWSTVWGGPKTRLSIQPAARQRFRRRIDLTPFLYPSFYYFENENLQQRFASFVQQMVHMDPLLWRNRALMHVFPMMRVLVKWSQGLEDHNQRRNVSTTTTTLPKLHYLPSLKDLSTTWPRFVYNACQTVWNISSSWGSYQDQESSSSSLFSLKQSDHKSTQDPYGTYAAARDVWNREGRVARALCLLHLPDYACWRDLPDGIPQLCQDVYQEPAIIQALNGALTNSE